MVCGEYVALQVVAPARPVAPEAISHGDPKPEGGVRLRLRLGFRLRLGLRLGARLRLRLRLRLRVVGRVRVRGRVVGRSSGQDQRLGLGLRVRTQNTNRGSRTLAARQKRCYTSKEAHQ